MEFINRKWEIGELNKWAASNKLVAAYGRRRVGKTRLLTHWMRKNGGGYSQAIEGALQLQLDQTMADLREELSTELRPTTWSQFFEIVDRTPGFLRICLDEFPYLVTTDPSLPSILQKWWDHKKKIDISVLLCGSSQKMMHSIFLSESSPLYGRASRILKVEPMDYESFCQACRLNAASQDSFLIFSMVGGIPKYWEYVRGTNSLLELADMLYFDSGSILENEPLRVLADEKVQGITPISVLEAIGRGVHRPSEISSRLGTHQTSLSKVFAQLVDSSMVVRETPFGISERDSKRSLYKLDDPMLSFWFSVYSGLRSRWRGLSDSQKRTIIYQHASHIFEAHVRKQLNGRRFWDSSLEFDVVSRGEDLGLTIYEVKFAKLTSSKRASLERSLAEKIGRSIWARKEEPIKPVVFDWANFVKSCQ